MTSEIGRRRFLGLAGSAVAVIGLGVNNKSNRTVEVSASSIPTSEADITGAVGVVKNELGQVEPTPKIETVQIKPESKRFELMREIGFSTDDYQISSDNYYYKATVRGFNESGKKWELQSNGFKNELPDNIKSYGFREQEVIAGLFGDKAKLLTTGAKIDPEFDTFGCFYKGQEKYFIFPRNPSEKGWPLPQSTSAFVHEAGHVVDPMYMATLMPYEQFIKVELGKWQLLSQMFTPEGKFVGGDNNLIFNEFSEKFGGNLYKVMIAKEKLSGELQKAYEQVWLTESNEIFAEMFSLGLTNQKLRQENPIVSQGLINIITGIRGVEVVDLEAICAKISQPSPEVLKQYDLEQAMPKDAGISIEDKRKELKYEEFVKNGPITGGYVRKDLPLPSQEIQEAVGSYRFLVIDVFVKWPELKAGNSVLHHNESFNPKGVSALEIERAVSQSYIKGLLLDLENNQVLDLIKLNNFVKILTDFKKSPEYIRKTN